MSLRQAALDTSSSLETSTGRVLDPPSLSLGSVIRLVATNHGSQCTRAAAAGLFRRLKNSLLYLCFLRLLSRQVITGSKGQAGKCLCPMDLHVCTRWRSDRTSRVQAAGPCSVQVTRPSVTMKERLMCTPHAAHEPLATRSERKPGPRTGCLMRNVRFVKL